MEKNIKKILLDEKDQIYIVDTNNILYLYIDNYHQFYPFLAIFDDIKKCFAIDNRFYVYHANMISVFDDNLYEIDKWSGRTINRVCYNEELDLITTLENNDVYINLYISDRPYYEIMDIIRIPLHRYNSPKIRKYNIQEIKILNDLLLTYNDHGEMHTYYLNPGINYNFNEDSLDQTDDNVQHIGGFHIGIDTFLNICVFDKQYNRFILENGDHLNLAGEYSQQNYIENLFNPSIYHHQKCFFIIRDEYLLVFYYKELFNTLIVPLITKIPAIEISKSIYYGDIFIITYILSIDCPIKIINGEFTQIIIHNQIPYIINEIDQTLKEIILDEEMIDFTKINHYYEKTDVKLVIDIDITKPIISQLINIIPSIYRLNNEMIYCFEQVDKDSNIISYGEGVTRHIFSTVRKEIDDLFLNKLSPFDKLECFKLGKLLYFCNHDGDATFFNINPYFFYALSTKGLGYYDHITLLKKFKSDKFDLLYKQYIQYKLNPNDLQELGMDNITTVDDFIKFLFVADLTDNQIELYDEIVKGYCFFAHRGKYHQLIKKLPVINYINQLVNVGYFDVDLYFSTSKNISQDDTCNTDFDTFCEQFKKSFAELSQSEKSIVVQNITGNQYYSGSIEIIYAYTNPSNLNDNESTDEILAYEISTCNTQLIFNIFGSQENISNIMKMLTIEDTGMKN